MHLPCCQVERFIKYNLEVVTALLSSQLLLESLPQNYAVIVLNDVEMLTEFISLLPDAAGVLVVCNLK